MTDVLIREIDRLKLQNETLRETLVKVERVTWGETSAEKAIIEIRKIVSRQNATA